MQKYRNAELSCKNDFHLVPRISFKTKSMNGNGRFAKKGMWKERKKVRLQILSCPDCLLSGNLSVEILAE